MAKKKQEPFQFEKAVELEAADRRLLQLLQCDNSLTNLQLAEKAHLSPPTCLRRVRRLQEQGIIVGNVALLDPFKVGRGLIVLVEVVLEKMQKPYLVAFENKVRSDPEVTQCYAISGDTDYLLIVHVADMAAYLRLIRRICIIDPNIRTFRSLFALERTKFTTEISLN